MTRKKSVNVWERHNVFSSIFHRSLVGSVDVEPKAVEGWMDCVCTYVICELLVCAYMIFWCMYFQN
jgi:hypothetical protein